MAEHGRHRPNRVDQLKRRQMVHGPLYGWQLIPLSSATTKSYWSGSMLITTRIDRLARKDTP